MTDESTERKHRRSRGDGRLFQRGGVWWIAYYHRGQEIRESAKTDSEQKAGRLLRERLRTAGRPDFIDPRAAERVTFTHLAEMYLTDYRVNGRRSLRDAQRYVETLRGTFGLDRALDITADRIVAYADMRRAKDRVAPATVNRELGALRRMFSLAVRAGKLASRPPVTLLHEDNIREGFIDPPEFGRLLAQLRARNAADVADAAEFAYLTCLRRGNVLGAQWSWFTLRIENGVVTGGSVRLPGAFTKNKQPLPLVLTGQLLELVARRWALRVAECPYVFHRNGRVIRDFRTTWVAACEAVGVPGLLFHDLRRSGARNYRRAQVAEDVIMRIGGWKTPNMFRRYNVVDERDLTEAAERLAGFLADAASAPPTIVPLGRSTPPGGGGFPQNTDRTRTIEARRPLQRPLDGRKLPNSIRGEGRGPVASPVFKT
jgi:integrase